MKLAKEEPCGRSGFYYGNESELPRPVGVDYTLHGGEDKVKEKIHAITNGAGVSTHIEETGVPGVGVQSLEWIGN